MHNSRILLVDIETAPNTVYVWGMYKQNISHEHVVANSYILCWSAKWLGERGVDYDSTKRSGARRMLKRMHAKLDKADIVVHYNGLSFDVPILNKEFLKHGMKPPAPYKQIDLLSVCRGAFRFDSNKLVAVTQYLGMATKLKHRGFQLWVGCMAGDAACWKEMERYNKRDVTVLETLYHRLLPWISRHPSLKLDRLACPKCSSTRTQKRGEMATAAASFQRYQCLACGGWFRSNRRKHTFQGERGVNI